MLLEAPLQEGGAPDQQARADGEEKGRAECELGSQIFRAFGMKCA